MECLARGEAYREHEHFGGTRLLQRLVWVRAVGVVADHRCYAHRGEPLTALRSARGAEHIEPCLLERAAHTLPHLTRRRQHEHLRLAHR